MPFALSRGGDINESSSWENDNKVTKELAIEKVESKWSFVLDVFANNICTLES